MWYLWALSLLSVSSAAAESAGTVPSPGPLIRKVLVDESRIAMVPIPLGGQLPVFSPDFDFSRLADQTGFGTGERAKRIADWYAAGTAAGNVGDLYENRDRGHSRLNLQQFGQLASVEYPAALSAGNLPVGAKFQFGHKGPALINASMALTHGPMRRSLGRLLLHDPALSPRLYPLYRVNDIFFYPEHNDHDPEHGDVYALNTPYLIISQGSSGSDRAFMEAVAQTLASFRPEVKEKLAENGLLAPTVQMILRWCYGGAGAAGSYLTGAAHPAVFDGGQLRPEAMVDLAQSIEMESLPPFAMIEMIKETEAKPGLDYMGPELSERLLDTPCAIGRIGRNLNYRRSFVVSAWRSLDLNRKPLTFHWKVLRGDPERISIEPLTPLGSRVQITVDYQPQTFPVGAEGLPASRVDIGAFVHNGDHYSAPALLSIWFPPNETREYHSDGRLRRVEYQNPASIGLRADPLLVFDLPWTDTYTYDASGLLSGWERVSRDKQSRSKFNALGEVRKRGIFTYLSNSHPVEYKLTQPTQGIRTISWEEATEPE